MTPTDIRPFLSLPEILGYSLFAFVVVLVLTPWFVDFLKKNKVGKQLRVETIDGKDPAIFRQFHQAKFGTPTMGGILMWGGIIVTVVFSRILSYAGVVEDSLLQRGQVYLPLFALASLGLLGALDDYLNIISADDARLKKALPRIKWLIIVGGLALLAAVGYIVFTTGNALSYIGQLTASTGPVGTVAIAGVGLLIVLFLALGGNFGGAILRGMVGNQKKQKGLGFRQKIFTLLLLSLVAGLWFHFKLGYETIHVPTIGDVFVGWWYVPIFMFIFIGTVNAVNFTDGLDGLAGGLLAIAFGSFAVIAYVAELYVLAGFCAVCVGAIAGFLWNNVPPAMFFMGDTGALALGGVLAVIAMMIEQPLILPLVGFIFVIEMLSVIIQLTSKRLRGGKKVFLSAPIHHHFEALGWGESKVTMRMWIVGGIMALLGVIVSGL
jgi:phospho-N-acetylmuramoyl-pentapeptide-transferase